MNGSINQDSIWYTPYSEQSRTWADYWVKGKQAIKYPVWFTNRILNVRNIWLPNNFVLARIRHSQNDIECFKRHALYRGNFVYESVSSWSNTTIGVIVFIEIPSDCIRFWVNLLAWETWDERRPTLAWSTHWTLDRCHSIRIVAKNSVGSIVIGWLWVRLLSWTDHYGVFRTGIWRSLKSKRELRSISYDCVWATRSANDGDNLFIASIVLILPKEVQSKVASSYRGDLVIIAITKWWNEKLAFSHAIVRSYNGHWNFIRRGCIADSIDLVFNKRRFEWRNRIARISSRFYNLNGVQGRFYCVEWRIWEEACQLKLISADRAWIFLRVYCEDCTIVWECLIRFNNCAIRVSKIATWVSTISFRITGKNSGNVPIVDDSCSSKLVGCKRG